MVAYAPRQGWCHCSCAVNVFTERHCLVLELLDVVVVLTIVLVLVKDNPHLVVASSHSTNTHHPCMT